MMLGIQTWKTRIPLSINSNYIRPCKGWGVVTHLTFSPGLTSVTGTRVVLKVGEFSTVRVSCSPTRVTFSFLTDTVFSVMVTSASGATEEMQI